MNKQRKIIIAPYDNKGYGYPSLKDVMRDDPTRFNIILDQGIRIKSKPINIIPHVGQQC